jgi:hypothetical protein
MLCSPDCDAAFCHDQGLAQQMLVPGRPSARLAVSHPLGGCIIRRDASEGVVDEFGRVFDKTKSGDHFDDFCSFLCFLVVRCGPWHQRWQSQPSFSDPISDLAT